MANESVKLIIQAEVKKAIGEMKKFNKQLGVTDNSTKKASSGMSNMSSVMAKAAIVTVALTVAYKALIQPASALQEAHSKFTVVFGDNIDQAEEWASVLVDSYAMSTREAYQYLASVQDLLKPMGLQPQLAAEMSNKVVQLAADLGSFNDVPTGQVIQDINSALVGNFETMKKYGVVLNETVIKNEALASGMWDGKGVIDASTKAQIAFKLSLKGSADAQGDMERTSTSWANVQKRLLAGVENMGASLGMKLLPALSNLGVAFLNLNKDAGIVTQSFGFLIDTLGLVINSIAIATTALSYFSDTKDIKILSSELEMAQNNFKGLRDSATQAYGGMTKFNSAVKAGVPDAVERNNQLIAAKKHMIDADQIGATASKNFVAQMQANSDAQKKLLENMGILTAKREAEKEADKVAADEKIANVNKVKENAIMSASEITAAKKAAIDGYNDYSMNNMEKEIAAENEKFEALMENKYLDNEQLQ